MWIAVTAVAAAVALGGGVAMGYSLTGGSSSGDTSAAAGASSPGAAPSVEPTPAGAPGSTSDAAPGWQSVAVPALGVTYDVPSEWSVSDSTSETLIGRSGTLTEYGRAVTGADYCPGSEHRALAFVTEAQQSYPVTAAAAVAKIAVQGGYSVGSGTSTASMPYRVKSGFSGQLLATSGSWRPSKPGCATTSYTVYAFAFTGPQNKILALTILCDRGVTGEVTEQQAKAIIATVRES